MQNLEVSRDTTSLCNHCLNEIPAQLLERDGTMRLHKICPDHGAQEAMVERDANAWVKLRGAPKSDQFDERLNTCLVPVTDRCNMRCHHCYHVPGSEPDPSIEDVVAICLLSKASSFVLMGAEPTVRKDLPELIEAIRAATNKPVSIYTNGIRLADGDYAQRLKNAGLEAVCLSMHTESYIGNSALWEAKWNAVSSIIRAGLRIEHIAFSMRNLAELEEVLRTAHEMWDMTPYFRIRAPARIGECADEPFFLSDLIPAIAGICREWGWSLQTMPADNNPYHIMLLIAGKPFRIIRWPSVEEVDLGELKCGPWALFVPELGEVNFVHSALVQEATRSKKGI